MSDTSTSLLIAAIMFTAAVSAFGLGSDYPADRPVKLDKAPPGLNELINDKGRVGGYFVNGDDRFFFSGDTAAFGAFLKHYGSVEPIAGHRLTIHNGPGRAKSPWDEGEGKPCDWMLEVALISWRQGHDAEVYRDPAPPEPKGEKPKAWYSDISASSPHLPLR